MIPNAGRVADKILVSDNFKIDVKNAIFLMIKGFYSFNKLHNTILLSRFFRQLTVVVNRFIIAKHTRSL